MGSITNMMFRFHNPPPPLYHCLSKLFQCSSLSSMRCQGKYIFQGITVLPARRYMCCGLHKLKEPWHRPKHGLRYGNTIPLCTLAGMKHRAKIVSCA